MSQIMRLRRRAGTDEHITDRNNGHRHEAAFVTLVGQYGLLNEAELLPRSYGGDSWFGKFHPAAARELLSSLSTVVAAAMRRKVTPKLALLGHKIPKTDLDQVKQIYKTVEERDQRNELNLYVTGYEDAPEKQSEEPVKETAQAPDQSQGQPEAAGAAGREPPGESSVPRTEEGTAATESEESR
jgi:succinate dehydrogenase / fumarate reductase iron-sulfur subunit